MKKTIKILLCALIGVASYSAYAQQDGSGTFGALNWSYTAADSALVITGTGEMPDSTAWGQYPWNMIGGATSRNHIRSVSIGEGVTSIGREAFRGVQFMTTATLPSTLTKIGACAFYDCRFLTTISPLPVGVTVIDSAVFRNAYVLSTITILGAVTEIKADAFRSLSSQSTLTSFTIPPTVHTIGATAFQGARFTSIDIPPSVKYIGNGAFTSTALTSFVMPATVEHWGDNLFQESRLGPNSVTFPPGITAIPAGMFRNTAQMTEITLPETIETIGANAFSGSGITSFTFPPSVTAIANSTFSNSKLQSIVIPSTITTLGNSVFNTCEELTSMTIPATITSLGNNFCENCTRLSSVTIPASGLETIGDRAFAGCPALGAFSIPGTVTSIGSAAFWNASNLRSPIVIPPGVKIIRENTFRNTRISSVVIQDSVTEIQATAFRDNNEMTSLEIGTGIETIGQNAFNSNRRLGTVTVKAAVPPITPGPDTLPPALNPNVFAGTATNPVDPANIILIVADSAAVEAYSEAAVWQDFMLICTSISEGISAFREEIARLNEELEFVEGEVDFFFGEIEKILGLEAGDIADFIDIEFAIKDLLDQIDQLQNDLDECEGASASAPRASNRVLLQVHPNPVTDEVRFTNEWSSGDVVEIYNTKGQNVFSQRGGEVGTTSEFVINMSNFKQGNYILRVGNRVAKVVKQ